MTSSAAREQEQQLPLMRVLIAAGANPDRDAIVMAAGHGELEALREVVEGDQPMSVLIAAALGADEQLHALLHGASPDDVQTAFGLAVINGRVQAARLALDAGADINARLPVHAHSTALHQAALGDDVALIELLLERGADPEQRDTLWDATPLGWAISQGRTDACAALEGRDARG